MPIQYLLMININTINTNAIDIVIPIWYSIIIINVM